VTPDGSSREEQLAYSELMGAMLDERKRRQKAQKILAVVRHALGRDDLAGLRALDVGCSAGFIADELALAGAHTTGVDIDEPGLVAARERFGERVEFSLARGEALPFEDGSMDVVVFNHIYEHVVDPDAVLADIRRVLKPDGTMYVSTKNRYAMKYLVGGPDEHIDNMRFGSVLPRPVLRVLRALGGKGMPRAMLHSYRHLRHMILSSGFRSADSYWAAPEMRMPTHYVPTDAASVRSARREGVLQGDSRKTRLLMPWVPAGMVKYFAPGLTFVARKGE